MLNPVTFLCALGCSTCSPSISQRYCWGVSNFDSCSERGHWYFPYSNLLYKRINPSFSQYNALSLSLRRPQKRKSVLVNGLSENCCCTILASPSMPRLKSVYPQATKTLSAPVKSLSIISPPQAMFSTALPPFRNICRLIHYRYAMLQTVPLLADTAWLTPAIPQIRQYRYVPVCSGLFRFFPAVPNISLSQR